MKISIFPDYIALAGRPVYRAFINYIKNHTPHEVVEQSLDADCAIIWSVLWHGRMAPARAVYQYYLVRNKPVIILEVGALQRNTTWRVSVDHIDNTGFYGTNLPLDMDRPHKLGLCLRPWQNNTDGHIVICTQHNQSQLWQNMPNMENWVEEQVNRVKEMGENKIIIRTHPRCNLPNLRINGAEIDHPKRLPNSYDDFDFDRLLENCKLLITHTSNTGIEALLKGVPVQSSSNSLYYGINHSNREEWLTKIAHTEWTVDEIARGLPFKRIENYCLSKLQRLPLNHSPTNS